MRLLLAEDNRELAHWLEKALVQGGFAVDCVADGRAADHLLQSEQYALAVLDIGMPGYDGLEVVQRLRKRGQTLPVLLLTARLRALLRRSEGQVHEVQQLGELAYCDEGYFLLRGQMLSLTPRELALLKVLMFRRTRPVSRQQLFEQVFSLSDDVSPESIELYIHRLRKKLQASNVRITTLRGLGYLLECERHEMG
ncbi:winged helix-turn-helix domain-containing protein [Klebsiella quasipneumoniae]|uniref:winged helix-turn-helix domain-containing protein n=1 Tax=Klebsiella quasipneumoniae TaxID=1463165 RepID=UPI002B053B12|nr:winged helix-turn-helix domain-containing protein [Klebsiella quasipneumoniae]